MSKEKIDLTKAVRDDKFLDGKGVVMMYYVAKSGGTYKHLLVGEDGITCSYTDDGRSINNNSCNVDNLVSKVEPSEQEVFNRNTMVALSEIVSVVEEIQARDKMLAALGEFREKRLDAAENRIDILMSERDTTDPEVGRSEDTMTMKFKSEMKEAFSIAGNHVKTPTDMANLISAQESFYKAMDEVKAQSDPEELDPFEAWWYDEGSGMNIGSEEELVSFAKRVTNIAWTNGAYTEKYSNRRNTIIEDYLKDDTITPKALLDLGFTEEYQPPVSECEGFIYYSFSKLGVELLSSIVSSDDGFYVFFEDQYEIHSLRKLGDLVLSLNEL
jgi:hypothetical protein